MTRPKPRYQPGDRIGGRYQMHQALMGGMGEVYLCLDLETDLPAALSDHPGILQSLGERSRNLGILHSILDCFSDSQSWHPVKHRPMAVGAGSQMAST
jgi:hypothetical protein